MGIVSGRVSEWMVMPPPPSASEVLRDPIPCVTGRFAGRRRSYRSVSKRMASLIWITSRKRSSRPLLKLALPDQSQFFYISHLSKESPFDIIQGESLASSFVDFQAMSDLTHR
jgi:hypothetical protein